VRVTADDGVGGAMSNVMSVLLVAACILFSVAKVLVAVGACGVVGGTAHAVPTAAAGLMWLSAAVYLGGWTALLAARIRDEVRTGAPVTNRLLTEWCTDPAVFTDRDAFPWTQAFRDHWRSILGEFRDYTCTRKLPAYRRLDEGLAVNTKGWRVLFLRAFGTDMDAMARFPTVKRLLKTSGVKCTTAFFSRLEPGTRIPAHCGVYKGVLRYHLGLVVPAKWDQCFIDVAGQRLHWREGEDLIFDDMFPHFVENNTEEDRVVLFLDFQREISNPALNLLNSVMLRFIRCNDQVRATVARSNAAALQADGPPALPPQRGK